jgi:hypothetical protein
VAAGAGVDRLLVPGPLQALGLQRRLDLLARAGAAVGQAGVAQAQQGLLIERMAL